MGTEDEVRDAIAYLDDLAGSFDDGAQMFNDAFAIVPAARAELDGGKSDAADRVAGALDSLADGLQLGQRMVDEGGEMTLDGAEALVAIIPHAAPHLSSDAARAADRVAAAAAAVREALGPWIDALPSLHGYFTNVDEAMARFLAEIDRASAFYSLAETRARKLAQTG